MPILNRRNALAGWAVFKLVKRLLRRKAQEVLPDPPKRRRPVKSGIAAVAALGVGVAAYLRSRRRG